MALIIKGRSRCGICGKAVEDPIVGFPAFLPVDHEYGPFSDAAFHRDCFEAHPQARHVHALYARYRAIWDSRPDFETLEQLEAWGRAAFKDFP